MGKYRPLTVFEVIEKTSNQKESIKSVILVVDTLFQESVATPFAKDS